MRGPAVINAVLQHRGPNGWVLGVVLVLAILYVGWRRRRVGKRQGLTSLRLLRGELRELRIRPLTLLPLALLVVVIVVLLVAH